MKLACLILVLFTTQIYAQTKTQIERINFFPEADAFAKFSYQYERLRIDTPQNTVMAKEVKNYKNTLSASYGHRFTRNLIAGLSLFLEEASENVVYYGIPLKRRFSSVGPKEPELFMIYRLRRQEEDKGLIDLYSSFSPKGHNREIGNKQAARWNGRNIFNIGLSHGMWEEEWEFRSSLEYIYYAEGQEKNDFANESYTLENYSDVIFNFKTQYRYSRWLFFFGTFGVEYHTTQKIKQPGNAEREIQAGTGSVFQLGVKKPLGDWSVLELNYVLKRNDYFVKATANNLEGESAQERFTLSLTSSF